MSTLVRFFYGSGTVRTNDQGVDLSEFQFVDMDMNAPATWSISQAKDWLTGCLGLNPSIYTVGVHALWIKSRTNAYFILRPVEDTSQWVRWLQGCEKR